MNGGDIGGFWQALQPDWPMVLMAGVILLLLLTLFAFLVVAVLLRRRNERKALRWSGYERDWGPVLDAVLAGGATSEAVREAIPAGEELPFVDFLYKQALRTDDAARRDVLGRLATPYLPLIEARTRGGDAERRARAVKTLAELGGSRYRAVLVGALDDPSPLVAMSAARALVRVRGGNAVRELVARIHRFSDWNRRFLRATLAQLGPAAAPSLRGAIRDALLPSETRAVCLDVLGEIAGPGEAAEAAEEVLLSEMDVDLRAAALRVLRVSGGAEHAPLVRRLCEDGDAVVRAQAIATLARIGGDADLDALERALRDPSPWVALHAARGLKQRDRADMLAGAHGAVALQVLREEA